MSQHNPELLVISAVLQTDGAKKALSSGVTRDWFHAYRREWEWVENYLSQYGKTPDPGTFVVMWPKIKLLKTTDLDFGLEQLREHHIRQSLAKLMASVADELVQGADNTMLIGAAQQKLSTLQTQTQGVTNEATLHDYDEPYLDLLRRIQQTQATGAAGIKTGIATLDKVTGGPLPGDLWIVGARLGQGKTFTMVKMATTAAMAGHDVLFSSLEMSRVQMMYRFHAFLSRAIGGTQIKIGELTKGLIADPFVYRDFLQDLPNKVPGHLTVNDTARGKVTVPGLAAQIEKHNPEIVFVDYLGLMATPGEWASVAEVSAGLKSLAMRYKIPIVAAAQINRSGASNNQNPGAEHLAGSDAIGQDADLLLTQRQRSAHLLMLSIVKNRHGKAGSTFPVAFYPNTGRFEEVDQDQAQEILDKDREQEAV